MNKYLDTLINSTSGTANWVWSQIKMDGPWYQNYFYGVLVISLVVWGLEILFPWRKNQKIIRKDFWLDGFYIFFNIFVFSIVISGFYEVVALFSKDVMGVSLSSWALINLGGLPGWAQLLIFFILTDFVQWATHVSLHRFNFLWRFHRVHHSVREMGFAAHFRYHWMENIFYKPLKTLIVMLIGGFEPEQAFIIHFMAITIGHLNHANVRITWGPLKYIINNSVMHLYHHAKALPKGQMPGVNFGISLSIWDYIFGTNYIPQDQDGTYELGFDHVEQFPTSFFKQITGGFTSDSNEE